MSDGKTDRLLDQLIREGMNGYLDGLYALHRFRREIIDLTEKTLNKRKSELAKAVGIHFARQKVSPSPYPDTCDGNETWIGSWIWVPEPWKGTCYLGIGFEREDNGSIAPVITFACNESSSAVFRMLSAAYANKGEKFFYESQLDRECGFCWKLDDPLKVGMDFDRMMDYVISVWTKIGGWKGLASK